MKHLKTYLVLMLTALLLVNMLGMAAIKVGYELNKGTITDLFCINKKKPALQCQGKCFLKKALKEAGEESSQQFELSGKSLSVEYLPTSEMVLQSVPVVAQEQVLYAVLRVQFTDFFYSDFSHPPQNIS